MDGKLEWELPLVSPPYGLEISPDKTLALSGSRSGRLNLIDLTKQTRRTLKGHTAHIFRLEWSPDGTLFASASYDNRSSIWNRDGTLLKMLPHNGKCSEIHFSPDGSLLASASWDGTTRLWEVPSGKELHRFSHTGDMLALSFTPNGKVLATGGKNNTIEFWDTLTGNSIGHPITLEGAIAELEYFTRKDGGLNIMATTWEPALHEPALHIIPLESGHSQTSAK